MAYFTGSPQNKVQAILLTTYIITGRTHSHQGTFFIVLTIANRLKKVLDILISKSQTGFISGGFIGVNTRLVYDIMHCVEKNNSQGLLMLVDFQKAFDSFHGTSCQMCSTFINLGLVFVNGLVFSTKISRDL